MVEISRGNYDVKQAGEQENQGSKRGGREEDQRQQAWRQGRGSEAASVEVRARVRGSDVWKIGSRIQRVRARRLKG